MNSFSIIRFKTYTNRKLSSTEASDCFGTISPTDHSSTMNSSAVHFHPQDLKFSFPPPFKRGSA